MNLFSCLYTRYYDNLNVSVNRRKRLTAHTRCMFRIKWIYDAGSETGWCQISHLLSPEPPNSHTLMLFKSVFGQHTHTHVLNSFYVSERGQNIQNKHPMMGIHGCELLLYTVGGYYYSILLVVPAPARLIHSYRDNMIIIIVYGTRCTGGTNLLPSCPLV